MENRWSKEQLLAMLGKYRDKAVETLNDDEKMEAMLQKVEEKLESIPKIGTYLAEVPVMISMLRAKLKGQYDRIPASALIAMVAGLLYFLSPIDLIPDAFGILGYADDAAVIGLVLKLVEKDVQEYKEWQVVNGKRDSM